MKKYLIALSCVIVCAILGIVVYCCIPKPNDLMVSVKNVSVKVGQKVKLEYSSTISNATMTFSVKDKDIAEVSVNGNDVYVTGRLEGKTSLCVLARYKDARFEETVDVVVSKTQEQDDSNNSGDGKQDSSNNTDEGNEEPVNPPIDSGDETNTNDPNNGDNVESDDIEITFIESNFVNFSIQDEVITILKDKKAIFSVESNVNGTIDVESLEITVTKLTNLGGKAFSLLATEMGEFEITIIVNDSYIKSYIVKVE